MCLASWQLYAEIEPFRFTFRLISTELTRIILENQLNWSCLVSSQFLTSTFVRSIVVTVWFISVLYSFARDLHPFLSVLTSVHLCLVNCSSAISPCTHFESGGFASQSLVTAHLLTLRMFLVISADCVASLYCLRWLWPVANFASDMTLRCTGCRQLRMHGVSHLWFASVVANLQSTSQ